MTDSHSSFALALNKRSVGARRQPTPLIPSESSNLCSRFDKPRHLAVSGARRQLHRRVPQNLRARSGPGSPHLMGNSLNSAHLGSSGGSGSSSSRLSRRLAFARQPASRRPLTQQPLLYLARRRPARPVQPTLGPPWPTAALAVLSKLSRAVPVPG